MSNRNRMGSRRRIILVFAVVSVMLTAVLALSDRAVPSASALPNYQVESTYYTDATRQVECGYSVLTCYGGVVKSGCFTRFADRTYEPCH